MIGQEIFLSAYRHGGEGPKCMIFRLDSATGQTLSEHAVGDYCSHAGGLAYTDSGRLFLSDTRRLYEISLESTRRSKSGFAEIIHTWELRFPLNGSFSAANFTGLWVGVFSKPKPSVLYRIPWSMLNDNKEDLWISDTDHSIEIFPASQGGCFDKEDNLWLSQSTSQYGRIQKVEWNSGRVIKEYKMMAGIEDLGCGAKGKIWSVSEAGSQRWSNWETFYPVVFSTQF